MFFKNTKYTSSYILIVLYIIYILYIIQLSFRNKGLSKFLEALKFD